MRRLAERRLDAPAATAKAGAVLAAHRPPSAIEPGPMGGSPFSFVRFVQPVLDRHCVKCHSGQDPNGKADLTAERFKPFIRSYVSLTRSASLVPRYPARNGVQVTPPGGKIGALGSGLLRMLLAGHPTDRTKGGPVKLTDDGIRRLAALIDLNAVFYGSCSPADNAEELLGRAIPMPEIQ